MSEPLPSVPSVITPPQPPLAHDTDNVATIVKRVVGNDLTIEATETPIDARQGVFVIHGRLTQPSHIAFNRWLTELRTHGYTPMLRHYSKMPNSTLASDRDLVTLYIHAGVPPQTKSRPWINLILFLLTVLCTLAVGVLYSGNLDGVSQLSDILKPRYLLQGWPFSVSLLSILIAHEFGHYLMARYHKVSVSLPFFIPLPPLSMLINFGTLGAFIRFREPIPDRRRLFDIGIAGPLAGLIVAIPILFIGLATSQTSVPNPNLAYLVEGNNIFYYFAKFLIFGKPLPNPITGEDVLMNQVTFAAWIGFFVTAMNLLPVGQLDGGHTIYALFGDKSRYINWLAIFVMALLGIAGIPAIQAFFPTLEQIGFIGWFAWILLIFLISGPHHPPALDEVTQLDVRRRRIGYLVIIIFVIVFIPTPFRIIYT